jgi:hypothetical protein
LNVALLHALQTIERRWPVMKSPAPDQPIFLLAAGWRSGSTLVQRMLSHRCLVWGEPFGRSGLIERLAESLCAFSEDWPPETSLIDHPSFTGKLGDKWTANLYPPLQHLPEAHADFYRRLFEQPARARGYDRWGLKEVRFGSEHAAYLRWVFPHARFLFLVRNPYACWASYRNLGEATFFRTWPDEPVDTPERFGRHWLDLADGFRRHHAGLGAFLLRYEDLTAIDFDPRPVADYLGSDLDCEARSARVGSSPEKPRPWPELERLQQVVGSLASEFGYAAPSPGRQ